MEIPHFTNIDKMISGLSRDENGNVDPADLLRLQMEMQQQARLWSTLQNVTKVRHDASMNAIMNMRNSVK